MDVTASITRSHILPLITAFMLLAYTAAASAQSGELTEAVISNWIASQQSLETWGEEHEDKIAEYEANMEQIDNPMAITADRMLQPLKAAGLYDDASKIVKQHDFSSLEAWAEATLRITKTAAALQFEAHPEAMDMSQLEAMINSPQISAEQKAMLTQAMEQNKAIIDQLVNGVSDKDKASVKPFLPKINALMDRDG